MNIYVAAIKEEEAEAMIWESKESYMLGVGERKGKGNDVIISKTSK